MAVTIRVFEPADAMRLNAGLSRLSQELGDTHRASDAQIARAGSGGWPSFRALLAENGDTLAGLVLYSPAFSTMRGSAGLYVSDLWVAPRHRSAGLGVRLLKAARAEGLRLWDARFVKLQVYDGSQAARRFYHRLGFKPVTGQADLILDEAASAGLNCVS